MFSWAESSVALRFLTSKFLSFLQKKCYVWRFFDYPQKERLKNQKDQKKYWQYIQPNYSRKASLCTYMIIIFQRKYLGKSMLIMMMSTLLALLAWTFKIPLHHMWVVPTSSELAGSKKSHPFFKPFTCLLLRKKEKRLGEKKTTKPSGFFLPSNLYR